MKDESDRERLRLQPDLRNGVGQNGYGDVGCGINEANSQIFKSSHESLVKRVSIHSKDCPTTSIMQL